MGECLTQQCLIIFPPPLQLVRMVVKIADSMAENMAGLTLQDGGPYPNLTLCYVCKLTACYHKMAVKIVVKMAANVSNTALQVDSPHILT